MSRRNQRIDLIDGLTFMAGGAILTTLCGVCTWNELHSKDEFAQLAVIGFVPIAVGAGLFIFGLAKVLRTRGG